MKILLYKVYLVIASFIFYLIYHVAITLSVKLKQDLKKESLKFKTIHLSIKKEKKTIILSHLCKEFLKT